MFSVLLTASESGSIIGAFLPIILMVVIFYFMLIRPQQREQKEKTAMLAEVAVGDTVLTSSGFYGVVIDIDEDTVIVEFGSNRNCRIPMQKVAIAAVEKPENAKAPAAADKGDKKGKRN